MTFAALVGVCCVLAVVGWRFVQLYRELGTAAEVDPLTKALNRRGFNRELDDALQGRADAETVSGLLIIDLDRFKEVNDTYGHPVGDRVLVSFTRRVRELIAKDDIFGRLGGDEFALLATREDGTRLRLLAEHIVEQARRPFKIGELQITVAASVGLAIDESDVDADQLMRRADIAMYTAKRNHVGVELFRPALDRRTSRRVSLVSDLRQVLADGKQLEMYLQPKLELATSTVVGAEALLRWNHPEVGLVDPTHIVRVAEENGLIYALTDRTLRKSVLCASKWWDDGLDLGLAVNLSPLDLIDAGLVDRIAAAMEITALPTGRLTLEITESSQLVDTPRAIEMVRSLVKAGIRLSLDDFGTGYSSLTYLRQLPAQELKIDQSFVKGVLVEPEDEVIVRATIDLGHNLGMDVVAEGIESDAVRKRLRELGCDLGQGHWFAEPMPAEEFGKWLNDSGYEVRRRPS